MRRLRIRLNAGFSGPQAGFFLAEADGLLAAAGILPEWLPGNGAAAVIADMDDDVCDVAYGDLCALVARLGREAPGSGPQAVFIGFNRTPLTIAVAADGPVAHPRDLQGARISGHARDAALVVFPALAAALDMDLAKIALIPSEASLGEQVRRMLEEHAAEGVFGFANTIVASLESAGLDLADRLRFLDYAEWLPDLYGNALVVSRRVLDQEPALVRGLVDAVARGFVAAIADPARGVAAIRAHAPMLDLAVDTKRWRGTIAREMAHPERAALGIGDADEGRLQRCITQLAAALRLPRLPTSREVFARDYLPPLEARRFP